jgi:AraC-like DNA-binding protein
MEQYNSIINALSVKFASSYDINVLNPLNITDFYDVDNTLILAKSSELYFGENLNVVRQDEILFIPGGRQTNIAYGAKDGPIKTQENFISERSSGLQNPIHSPNGSNPKHRFITVSFKAKVFDAVHFFTSLDIPPFIIQKNENIISILNLINDERSSLAVGNTRKINALTELLIIEIIRYLIDNKLFLEQFITKSSYLKDPRLIKIFEFIKDNLEADLSNKQLAKVVGVSEDYVGQYFKMLTGINLQDYIEYQRMEKAVVLLRTTKKSIQDVGKNIGYKDTAYFCRRFKMMFGITARKMRNRELMINS